MQKTKGASEECGGHMQQDTVVGWHLSFLACGCTGSPESRWSHSKEMMNIKAITLLMQKHIKTKIHKLK